MKGWIEVGDAQMPISGIELRESTMVFTGELVGPFANQFSRPVIIGHDSEPVYRCSSNLNIPRLRRGEPCTITLRITIFPTPSMGVRDVTSAKVFT